MVPVAALFVAVKHKNAEKQPQKYYKAKNASTRMKEKSTCTNSATPDRHEQHHHHHRHQTKKERIATKTI